MKIEDSDLHVCDTCNVIETIEHFFFHCTKIKCIWSQLNKDINLLLGIQFQLTEEHAILGIDKSTTDKLNISSESYKKANLMILITKNCISKYRYGTYENLNILYEWELLLRKVM